MFSNEVEQQNGGMRPSSRRSSTTMGTPRRPTPMSRRERARRLPTRRCSPVSTVAAATASDLKLSLNCLPVCSWKACLTHLTLLRVGGRRGFPLHPAHWLPRDARFQDADGALHPHRLRDDRLRELQRPGPHGCAAYHSHSCHEQLPVNPNGLPTVSRAEYCLSIDSSCISWHYRLHAVASELSYRNGRYRG